MTAVINWNFNKDDCKPELIEVGDHRVRIEEAEVATSKAGNQMIKLTLAVSGTTSKAWYYLVFPDKNDPRFAEKKVYTNKNLDSIRDSFDIPDKDILVSINPSAWVGKVGAARFKQEINDNDGTMQSKISYFLRRNKQDVLPAWQEPYGGAPVEGVPDIDFGSLREETDGTDDLFPFGDNKSGDEA